MHMKVFQPLLFCCLTLLLAGCGRGQPSPITEDTSTKKEETVAILTVQNFLEVDATSVLPLLEGLSSPSPSASQSEILSLKIGLEEGSLALRPQDWLETAADTAPVSWQASAPQALRLDAPAGQALRQLLQKALASRAFVLPTAASWVAEEVPVRLLPSFGDIREEVSPATVLRELQKEEKTSLPFIQSQKLPLPETVFSQLRKAVEDLGPAEGPGVSGIPNLSLYLPTLQLDLFFYLDSASPLLMGQEATLQLEIRDLSTGETSVKPYTLSSTDAKAKPFLAFLKTLQEQGLLSIQE